MLYHTTPLVVISSNTPLPIIGSFTTLHSLSVQLNARFWLKQELKECNVLFNSAFFLMAFIKAYSDNKRKSLKYFVLLNFSKLWHKLSPMTRATLPPPPPWHRPVRNDNCYPIATTENSNPRLHASEIQRLEAGNAGLCGHGPTPGCFMPTRPQIKFNTTDSITRHFH